MNKMEDLMKKFIASLPKPAPPKSPRPPPPNSPKYIVEPWVPKAVTDDSETPKSVGEKSKSSTEDSDESYVVPEKDET